MGKSSDLSPRKTTSVKLLLEEKCYSQREIAKRLSISQKSVSRIKLACDQNLSYESRRVGKCGRKAKMSERLVRKLKNIVKTNRRHITKQLTDQINDYGANVSPKSVRRVLKSRRPRKKQKITPTMAKKRLEWAKGLRHWTVGDWEKVSHKINHNIMPKLLYMLLILKLDLRRPRLSKIFQFVNLA